MPGWERLASMNAQMCRVLSTVFFQAGVFSILLSIFIWWYLGSEDPAEQAHAERFGIFVGLWSPTLLILSNRFDRFADKAEILPGQKSEVHEDGDQE